MREDGWVVDASVILKWSLRDAAEGHVDKADSLYEAFLARRIDLVAPQYARYEVANALDVAWVQGRIDGAGSAARFEWFLRTPISQPTDDDTLLLEAMAIARRESVAFYDAMYVALAERLGYSFVTADRKLYTRLSPSMAPATWIGDVPSFS